MVSCRLLTGRQKPLHLPTKCSCTYLQKRFALFCKTCLQKTYTVFFKAKDADAITSVLKEYAAKQTKRKKSMEKDRPSILQKLKKFKELVANLPHKAKEKIKEPER